AGIMELHLTDDRQVVVDMGRPILEPAQVPFLADQFAPEYRIQVDGVGEVALGAVSMGNPHAVIRVDNIDTAPVELWGPKIEPHHIRLRVDERGAGETLACGTGGCAAVVSGQLRGWLQPGVTVSLPGGDLFIEWDGESNVRMTGPAVTVFEGRINL